MANSASVNNNKISYHFKFNRSEINDLQPKQFVSSPVFYALGNEWVIDCYPRSTRQEWSRFTSFLVRLHGEYKTVNPTISLSLMKRDGTTSPLSHQYRLKGDDQEHKFRHAIQNSPFEGQVLAYGDYSNLLCAEDIVDNGSFELICTIDRCSLGVPKSFDLQSQIGQLLKNSETADVTFCVKNRSFGCHRLILAARSPVFKAMLCGNRQRQTQKQIKIADMCPKVFEAMLQFIYTDSVPSCNSEKTSMKFTQQLFVAAGKYAIEGLKALCEDNLCSHISLDTVTTTLIFALQHNSPRLKKACLDFIAEPETLISWMLTKEYVDLCKRFPSIMAEIRGKINTIPAFRNVKK